MTRLRAIALSGVVFGLAVAQSLWLASLVPDGTFYSGDSGLRVLQTSQFGLGRFAVDLQLPAEPWVRELWDAGLYPFDPPHVIQEGGRRYVVFPFLFPLINSPLYRLWGFTGLRVVPLAALWLLWYQFLVVCRRSGCDAVGTAAGLAALAFATPVTVYGVIYWEHTLAILLSFMGFAALVRPFDNEPSPPWALLGGSLLALAGWFREELFCLAAIIAILILAPERWCPWREVGLTHHRRQVVLGLILTGACWVGLNLLAYRRAFGLHGALVLDGFVARPSYGERTAELVVMFVGHCPAALLALGACLVPAWSRREHRFYVSVTCVIVAFVLAVAFVVPSTGGLQWGPRFLLGAMPLSCWAVARGLSAAWNHGRVIRTASAAGFLGVAVVGAYQTYGGARHLAGIYEQRRAALEMVVARSGRVVAVSHPYVTQQLLPALRDRDFFLIHRQNELLMLSKALMKRRVGGFIYVCYRRRPCRPLPGRPDVFDLPFPPLRRTLRFTKRATADEYDLYDAALAADLPARRRRLPPSRRSARRWSTTTGRPRDAHLASGATDHGSDRRGVGWNRRRR